MTTFNFFLVIVGLLLVAYGQAVEHGWRLFGSCLGFVGTVVSVGFLVIDVRNEVFVNRGIDALEELEKDIGVAIGERGAPSAGLSEALGNGRIARLAVGWIDGPDDLGKRKKRANVFKYRFWFRRVIILVGGAFAAGLLWAVLGFPTAGQSSAETCRTSTVLVLHRPGFDLNLVQRSEREGEQRGSDDDRGRPDDGLSGDLHVQSVSMGDYKRVQTGRHCGKQAVGGG